MNNSYQINNHEINKKINNIENIIKNMETKISNLELLIKNENEKNNLYHINSCNNLEIFNNNMELNFDEKIDKTIPYLKRMNGFNLSDD